MMIGTAFRARLTGVAAAILLALGVSPARADPSFSVTLPAGATNGPVTGRLIVVAASTDTPEPRLWTGMNGPPSFGIDVDAFTPGAVALVDQHAVGYPIDSEPGFPPPRRERRIASRRAISMSPSLHARAKDDDRIVRAIIVHAP